METNKRTTRCDSCLLHLYSSKDDMDSCAFGYTQYTVFEDRIFMTYSDECRLVGIKTLDEIFTPEIVVKKEE